MTDITLPRIEIEQALEALEDACGGRCNAEYNPCWQRNVADALRERLAQPERHELQAKGEHPAPCARHCEANAFQIVIKNLEAQLAQPEQIPPSAYSNTHQPEQEPVASVGSLNEFSAMELVNRGFALTDPLYTAPPQRTWVWLTEVERNVINRHNVYVSDLIGATEAKLKEKNT